MNLLKNKLYREDLAYVSELNLPWEKLKKKSILLSGATGMIGSFLIDVIMYKNLNEGLCCHIYAVGRNEEKARNRFKEYWENDLFDFVQHDVNKAMDCIQCNHVNYVLHLASNTHPMAYSTDPIGTITTNIMGVYNMLEFADRVHAERMAFVSSNEIYGENRGDVEKFDEKYLGYIDCNTMRAGYPESKRCGEALCQAYGKKYDLNFVIPRLCRTYGPTMSIRDSKAIAQFIKNAASRQDIVLKSDGRQYYSYIDVFQAAYAILYIMFKGENQNAYNISSDSGNWYMKDVAEMAANSVGKKVVYDLPDEKEKLGFSTATKALLDNSKLKKLGWSEVLDCKEVFNYTIEVIRKRISEKEG